jgi:predicted phage-related endonuclease
MAVVEEREPWLCGRSKGLGGTDIASLLGVSPWTTPLDVWRGKTEPTADFSKPTTEAMEWGNALEALVADKYGRVTQTPDIKRGADIAPLFPNRSACWGDHTIVKHPEFDYLIGTPDGVAPSRGRGLEIKTQGYKKAEYGWGAQGTDEIPFHYWLQCSWYMIVCSPVMFPKWDVAVLFQGNRLELFQITHDAEIAKKLVDRARQFWNDNVLKNVAPSIDETESWSRYLGARFNVERRPMIEADPEITRLAYKLDAAQHAKAIAEANERLAKNNLMSLIGDAKGAQGDWGKVQWIRPQAGKYFDWEAAARALFAYIRLPRSTKKNMPLLPETLEELVAEHYTTTRQATAYLRAFFKEDTNGDRVSQLDQHL